MKIPSATLEWLLEDDNPPVRNFTKQNLNGEDISVEEQFQVNEYLPTKNILSLIKSGGYWSNPKKPYMKYTGNFWQFIFLCELNAEGDSNLINKVADHIFSLQLPDSGFSHELKFRKPLICLTANILRSFLHFGYYHDERVQKGIDLITRYVIEDDGTVCFDQLMSLLPSCQMALTKVLSMFTFIDSDKRDADIHKAMDIIVNRITENRIHRYVPAGSKEFHKAIKGKRVAEIRRIKGLLSADPANMVKSETKSSWRRFGFPHSYTSDALETLYWLAVNNVKFKPEFAEAVEQVKKQMEKAGYWLNENKFRGPMLVEIEEKKSPSKWLTYRACYVLKKYDEVEFT